VRLVPCRHQYADLHVCCASAGRHYRRVLDVCSTPKHNLEWRLLGRSRPLFHIFQNASPTSSIPAGVTASKARKPLKLAAYRPKSDTFSWQRRRFAVHRITRHAVPSPAAQPCFLISTTLLTWLPLHPCKNGSACGETAGDSSIVLRICRRSGCTHAMYAHCRRTVPRETIPLFLLAGWRCDVVHLGYSIGVHITARCVTPAHRRRRDRLAPAVLKSRVMLCRLLGLDISGFSIREDITAPCASCFLKPD
jgi:hypothetical protein